MALGGKNTQRTAAKKDAASSKRRLVRNPIHLSEDEADALYARRALQKGDFIPLDQFLREHGYTMEPRGSSQSKPRR
jgi:hypothetical protein